MNAHWEFIIVISMQYAQILQEVIYAHVMQDILEMVLIVLVILFFFPFFSFYF